MGSAACFNVLISDFDYAEVSSGYYSSLVEAVSVDSFRFFSWKPLGFYGNVLECNFRG
jgi:hypothetical protein